MNTAPQELLKEYVQSQHFTSTVEIMSAMKEIFRDVIQTVMCQRQPENVDFRRNGMSFFAGQHAVGIQP